VQLQIIRLRAQQNLFLVAFFEVFQDWVFFFINSWLCFALFILSVTVSLFSLVFSWPVDLAAGLSVVFLYLWLCFSAALGWLRCLYLVLLRLYPSPKFNFL
jgi:hypothetical protein